MGCFGSKIDMEVEEARWMQRLGPVLPVGGEAAPRLCLVERGSPNQCVFDEANIGESTTELSLTSHPGCGIVARHAGTRSAGIFAVIELGVGVSDASLSLRRSEKRLLYDHESMCLSVPSAVHPGCTRVVNLVRGPTIQETFSHGTDLRSWVAHDDGTIAPYWATNLVLGIQAEPKIVLVDASSDRKLVVGNATALAVAKSFNSAVPILTSDGWGVNVGKATTPDDMTGEQLRACELSTTSAGQGRFWWKNSQLLQRDKIVTFSMIVGTDGFIGLKNQSSAGPSSTFRLHTDDAIQHLATQLWLGWECLPGCTTAIVQRAAT